MPPQRGRMRRTCWRPSTTTLFKPSVVPWTPFTNCQKKERSLPAPLFDVCPLHEGNRARVMGRHLLVVAITTKRLPRSANQEKGGFPAPPVRRIAPIHQKGRIYAFTPLQTPPLSAETLINEKPLGSLVPGASVPMTRPAHAPPGKAT